MPAIGLALVLTASCLVAGDMAHYGWCWSGCRDGIEIPAGIMWGVGFALCFLGDVRRLLNT